MQSRSEEDLFISAYMNKKEDSKGDLQFKVLDKKLRDHCLHRTELFIYLDIPHHAVNLCYLMLRFWPESFTGDSIYVHIYPGRKEPGSSEEEEKAKQESLPAAPARTPPSSQPRPHNTNTRQHMEPGDEDTKQTKTLKPSTPPKPSPVVVKHIQNQFRLL